MIHFPLQSQAGRSARGSPSGWDGGQGRVPGPLAWPVLFLASSFLQRRPSPASGALFSCPPGPPPNQPALSLRLSFPHCSLCARCPRYPVPPRATSRLRSSRHPDPLGVPSRGQESSQSPLATTPPASCRLAAESPLPQEPAPISCPLALSPIINIGDGSAGSRHCSEAGLSPASISEPSFQPNCLCHPSGLRDLVAPSICAGWCGHHILGCRWHPPCSHRLCGESLL